MTTKKGTNVFDDIINARQQQGKAEPPAAIIPPRGTTTSKEERSSKRGNPDYSTVTVYIPTEIYARAQFEMTRRGRKREMSALFTELLEAWLIHQS